MKYSLSWREIPRAELEGFPEGSGSQLFQLLGELWSCYNGKWFSSHRFGFESSGKLEFGLNTHMT